MGIYVSEITMPEGEGSKLVLQIFPNGEVYDGHGIRLGIANWSKAVPVPPHGRLIDADALAEHKFVSIPHVSIDGKNAGTAYRLGWNTAIEAIMENAKTIIGEE